MNRMRWAALTMRYALTRRLGWPGMLGILLVGLTIFAALAIAPRWRGDAQEIRRQAGSLEADFRRAGGEHRTVPKTGEQLDRFTAWFPVIDRNAEDLRRMMEQAQRLNLNLGKGEYHIGDEQRNAFASYEVVLSVKTDYATVRRFIAGVLNAVPNASLADLHIERAAVNSTIQDARIHFTFVYHGA